MRTVETKEYRRAYAVAKSIATRKDKRSGILYWCDCVKAMLNAGSK